MKRIKTEREKNIQLNFPVSFVCTVFQSTWCIGLIRGCYSHLRDQTVAYARKTTFCDIVLEPPTRHNIGWYFPKYECQFGSNEPEDCLFLKVEHGPFSLWDNDRNFSLTVFCIFLTLAASDWRLSLLITRGGRSGTQNKTIIAYQY